MACLNIIMSLVIYLVISVFHILIRDYQSYSCVLSIDQFLSRLLVFTSLIPVDNKCNLRIILFFFLQVYFFLRFYLFSEREGKGGRKRIRETSMCGRNINWLPLACPQLGTQPTIQTCALTGNQTGNLLVHRRVLNPLRYTSQGYSEYSILPRTISYQNL